LFHSSLSAKQEDTGMALGWIGSTTAFGDVVRNEERSGDRGFDLVPRASLGKTPVSFYIAKALHF
jgi:hypothetical protein